MSSSSINSQLFQAKAGSIQNQADSSSIYSAGVWSFKNSTAVASVTITDAGNVGIGTASPRSIIEVSTASETNVAVFGRNGLAQQVIQTDGTINLLGGQADGNGPSIVFNHQNVSNGSSTGKGARIVGFRADSGSGRAMGIDFKYADGGGVTQQGMRIDASGALRVGNTSGGVGGAGAVHALGYNTRAGFVGGSFGSNIFNFNWTGSAQLWIDSTNVGTITLTSDYRIKKNVETQELPALERIAQLRPVKYEYTDYKELYKADGIQREGFIAHELQAVIPSAVEGEKDAEGQIQSLKLDALCSVMVKAIQEQQAQIEALKAEVAALKAP